VVDGNIAGQTKGAGLLTFASVLGAGHMISLPFSSVTVFGLIRFLRPS